MPCRTVVLAVDSGAFAGVGAVLECSPAGEWLDGSGAVLRDSRHPDAVNFQYATIAPGSRWNVADFGHEGEGEIWATVERLGA